MLKIDVLTLFPELISVPLSQSIMGRAAEAGQALMDGAQAAIDFSLSLAGGICLWSAISELMERCGGTLLLTNLLRHFGRVDVLAEQLLEQYQGLLGTFLAEGTYQKRLDIRNL